jgi:hypothetical protein
MPHHYGRPADVRAHPRSRSAGRRMQPMLDVTLSRTDHLSTRRARLISSSQSLPTNSFLSSTQTSILSSRKRLRGALITD